MKTDGCDPYLKYSHYLKNRYGEKVYKLPIHLKGTCPNRDGKVAKGGCIFCGEIGAGFEMQSNCVAPLEQLRQNMAYIGEKYSADKFIAYFQNFTGTYMPIEHLKEAVEAVLVDKVVGVSISTRPDCIAPEHLDYFKSLCSRGYDVEIELGLQSINPNTLKILNRGHTLTDFIDATMRIKAAGLTTCTHLIGNLPWDSPEDLYEAARLLSLLKVDGIKVHSLYILKDTPLGKWYEAGEVTMISPEAYIHRVVTFLRVLSPDIAVQRLFGRAPSEETLFCNWGMSWRKLQNELEDTMKNKHYRQGDLYRRPL